MTKKEEYINKMTSQLKEWSAKIDELESKAKREVKHGYESTIRELREKSDTVSQKLHELRDSSGDAWETMKSGVESARDNFKTAYNNVLDKLKFKKAA